MSSTDSKFIGLINKMNILKILLAITTVAADLIGYNRLGNNVNGHVKQRLQKRSQSNYLRQLQKFLKTHENDQAKIVKHYINSNFKKTTKRRVTRRSLYLTNMLH